MIELKSIKKEELPTLYKIIYNSKEPAWTKFNAPYFKEYKYMSYEHFIISNDASFLLSYKVRGIYVYGEIIGVVQGIGNAKIPYG